MIVISFKLKWRNFKNDETSNIGWDLWHQDQCDQDRLWTLSPRSRCLMPRTWNIFGVETSLKTNYRPHEWSVVIIITIYRTVYGAYWWIVLAYQWSQISLWNNQLSWHAWRSVDCRECFVPWRCKFVSVVSMHQTTSRRWFLRTSVIWMTGGRCHMNAEQRWVDSCRFNGTYVYCSDCTYCQSIVRELFL